MASLFENNDRKYFSLCQDWTFHYVFSKDTEESRQARMGMLNVILNREEDPIVEIQILNPVYYGWRKDGKQSVLDIKAKTEKEEQIDIEMENGDLTYYGNRSLVYGGRMVNSSLESGEKYDKMKKVSSSPLQRR